MDERPTISPIVVEAFVLLNFAMLLAALLLLPFLQPSAAEVAVLGFSLVVNVAVAFLYALFILRYQPPVGARLIRKGDNENARALENTVYNILN